MTTHDHTPLPSRPSCTPLVSIQDHTPSSKICTPLIATHCAPTNSPLRTPLRAVQVTPQHQLTSDRLQATLPRCGKQPQGHLLHTLSAKKGTKLQDHSQYLFNRLAQSTIKRSSRQRPLEDTQDSIKLKLESKLSEEICLAVNAAPPNVPSKSSLASTQNLSSKQDNFYEYEEELLKVVWERVAPIQHQRCTNPVAKWLDKVRLGDYYYYSYLPYSLPYCIQHLFVPVSHDKTNRHGLVVKL